jgi:hypothetical protein
MKFQFGGLLPDGFPGLELFRISIGRVNHGILLYG